MSVRVLFCLCHWPYHDTITEYKCIKSSSSTNCASGTQWPVTGAIPVNSFFRSKPFATTCFGVIDLTMRAIIEVNPILLRLYSLV